jgi:hypothetical protein
MFSFVEMGWAADNFTHFYGYQEYSVLSSRPAKKTSRVPTHRETACQRFQPYAFM